jgi:WD40 repeat protein
VNFRTSSRFRRIAILAFLILAVISADVSSVTANELAWQTYNEAGERFVNSKSFAEAEEVLNHAISAAREMNSNDHLKTSLTLLVRTYDGLKKVDKAESARKELGALGGVVPPAPAVFAEPVSKPAAIAVGAGSADGSGAAGDFDAGRAGTSGSVAGGSGTVPAAGSVAGSSPGGAGQIDAASAQEAGETLAAGSGTRSAEKSIASFDPSNAVSAMGVGSSTGAGDATKEPSESPRERKKKAAVETSSNTSASSSSRSSPANTGSPSGSRQTSQPYKSFGSATTEFDGLGASEKPIRFAAGTGEPVYVSPQVANAFSPPTQTTRSVTGFTQGALIQNSGQSTFAQNPPQSSPAIQSQIASPQQSQEAPAAASSAPTSQSLKPESSAKGEPDVSNKDDRRVRSNSPQKAKSKDAFSDGADSEVVADGGSAIADGAAPATYGSYDQVPAKVSGDAEEIDLNEGTSAPNTSNDAKSAQSSSAAGAGTSFSSNSFHSNAPIAPGSETSVATQNQLPPVAKQSNSVGVSGSVPTELQDMEGGTEVERLIRSLARQQAGLPPLASKPSGSSSLGTGSTAQAPSQTANATNGMGSGSSASDGSETMISTAPVGNEIVSRQAIASAPPAMAAVAAGQAASELRQMQGHIDWIKTIAFAPDTNFAASAGSDQVVRYWDVNSGKAVSEFKGHKGDINGIAFSKDGSKLVSGSDDKTVRLFDVASATEERVFYGHKNLITCVAISPDMKRVASGGYDSSIMVFNADTKALIGSLSGHNAVVRDIMFTPDGEKIVSCSDDRTIIVWSAKTLKPISKLEGHDNYVLNIDVSEDGKRLLSGGRDLTARLWDLESGKLLQTMRGHSDWILRVKFMKGSNQAVTGSLDKTVRIWDLSSGALQSTVDGFNWGVFGEDFAPDKQLVLTGSNDKTVRVWSLPH